MRAAASRTFCTAGKSREIRTPTIAITTSRSIRVKPGGELFRLMAGSLRGPYNEVIHKRWYNKVKPYGKRGARKFFELAAGLARLRALAAVGAGRYHDGNARMACPEGGPAMVA